MRPPAQTWFAAALALILSTGISGCAAGNQHEGGTQNELASCDEILPKQMATDILGRSGKFVRLHKKEADAVDPLVDKMVTDGIACGGMVNEVVIDDGAVMVGQLAMSKDQWTATQSEFSADGHEPVDDVIAGWVFVSKPSDDPTLGSGFAWRDGVLYYLQNPLFLGIVPPFASEWAEGAPPL